MNVTETINASQLWVARTDVTANLSRLNVSATALDSRQATDNATLGNRQISTTYPLAGGGNLQADRTVSITTNATIFSDTVQSIALGARTWGNVTFSNASMINVTVTGGLQNPTISWEFNNISLSNLDARQKSDNTSVARTNVGNTFTGNQFISGNLNVSALTNLTNLTVNSLVFVNIINGTNLTSNATSPYSVWIGGSVNVTGLINTTNLTVTVGLSLPSRSVVSDYIDSLDQAKLSITLPVANTTGAFPQSRLSVENVPLSNITTRNGTLVTDAVQSIAASNGQRIWGNVSLDNSSMINFTISSQSVTAAFNNISLSNLDAREAANNASAARTNVVNTFSASQIIQGNLNVTGLINATNLTVGALPNATIPAGYSVGINGNVNVSGLVNATQLLVYGTDVTANLSRLNISATNLDARQAADNASVARTDRSNSFTGGLNATTLSNFTQIEVGGVAGTSNLTLWRSPTGLIAALNTTGGLELAGGLRVTTLTNCDTLDTDADGNFRCGSDAQGAGGGNTGWTTAAALVYNDTAGVNVTIGTQNTAANYKVAILGGLNVTETINATTIWASRTDILANLSRLNVSATALEARQSADNTSVARTDRTNTFSANQIITGDLNVTGLVNATNLSIGNTAVPANYVAAILGSLNISNILNATQLWIARTDVTLNLSRLNISTTLLEERQRLDNASVARTDRDNTFSGTQFLSSVNASNLINVTNITVGNRPVPPGYLVSIGGNANVTGTINASIIIGNLSNPAASVHGGVYAETCGGTLKATGIATNGSITCATDETGSGGGNTGWTTTATTLYNDTSGVSILVGTQTAVTNFIAAITGNLNLSGLLNVTNISVGNRAVPAGYAVSVGGNVNVSGTLNASIVIGNISNPAGSVHGGVYSETCAGTMKVIGIATNGSVTCGADQTGSGGGSPVVINWTIKDFSTNSNTALVNTSLSFALTAHKNYTMVCELMYTAAAATTGMAVQVASSVAGQNVSTSYETWSSATAKVGFSATAFSTNMVGTGSGAAVIYTSILTSAFQAGTTNHNITIAFRSEVSGSMVVMKRGSNCQLYDNELA